jgi:DNA polymerase III subunit epsilon
VSVPESSSAPLRFAIVDVETSGLEMRSDQILQLAVVALDLDSDGQIHTSEWSTMVRTRFPWDSVGPRHIHGIRRRSLWGAPSMRQALDTFEQQIAGRIFTAHNAAFDSGFLFAAAQRSGRLLHLDPRLCTLELSRRLDPDKKLRHRLADIAERHGIPHDNPHDALEDARTTAAILPQLLKAHGVSCYQDLQPHFLRPVDYVA